ncbi:hypothetical protein BSS2_II0783 [Brucella suis bv. 1 str. S2]|uniref:Uncharacterized protein n=8 Tax=Brucella TaxID=234 RepID=Q2YIZ2_BRUA2|nr:hypothetical protein BRA0827 [Brucella suis 1330]AAX75834.1 hypothetical protein BruAb2_0405 [Brucella abortus bv. 1 str. 9-941]ABQ62733.1 hypothetical protein BOV_A0776 [Brucella ovis ATCC 25840]ABX64000.1 Hypothetical protein, conserved [Brucella canis ATCC 23365]ABY39780.1 Hypothetical protein, conserved [Brucella suis ATCC 23445]ACO02608.1 Hypothetical protein, conserved [Brucella melitensis ATCC 23457]ACU49938.1 hypothetical protein BMI_II820 [Brucella microti CCM 4915]AEK56301.1 hyp
MPDLWRVERLQRVASRRVTKFARKGRGFAADKMRTKVNKRLGGLPCCD